MIADSVPEGLSDLLFAVSLFHFSGHHREKFGKIDCTVSCRKVRHTALKSSEKVQYHSVQEFTAKVPNSRRAHVKLDFCQNAN